MPIIKNIQVEKLEFGDIAARLQRAYPFLKLDQTDIRKIKELTPGSTQRIAFDLLEANTALANGWRRVVLDELRWPRLTCAMEDIRTDDAFNARLTDYIQNRIQLIPTAWLVESEKKSRYELNVANTTQQNTVVKSNEIRHVAGPEIKFDTRIDLCNLMPGRMIKIQIEVEWGINRDHASFNNFHGVIYRALTIAGRAIPEKLPPSYSVHPDGYHLGLTSEAMVDPHMVATMAWRTIDEKLDRAAANVAAFAAQMKAGGTLPYLSDALSVTQIRGGIIRYEFKAETLTLTNLVAWYAYQADPSVTYLQPGDDHPEDPSSLIRIVHKDHARLLENAARAALRDVREILRAFD